MYACVYVYFCITVTEATQISHFDGRKKRMYVYVCMCMYVCIAISNIQGNTDFPFLMEERYVYVCVCVCMYACMYVSLLATFKATQISRCVGKNGIRHFTYIHTYKNLYV
jgi:hypothetical protein